MVMSLSTTVTSNGTLLDADSSQALQGFRFWVEQTNTDGGLQFNGERVPVDIRYYDDASDPGTTEGLYQQLFDDGVDILFGGLHHTTTALERVSRRNGILAISCCAEQDDSNNPLLFGVRARMVKEPSFVLTEAVSQHDARRLAIVTASSDKDEGALCNLTKQEAQRLGMTVVHEARFDIGSVHTLLAALASSRPEVLVACTSKQETVALVQAAVAAHALQGSEVAGSAAVPGWIDSPFLRFVIARDLPDRRSLTASLGGFVHNVITIQQWHHSLNYSDPYFGSTAAVDREWMLRHDYGRGQHLSLMAASAIATGVMLRIGIEQAGSVDSAVLAAHLRGLERETLFGRLQMEGGENSESGKAVTIQWDCSSSECVDRVVSEGSSSALQPLPASCELGSLREVEVRDDVVVATCQPCMSSDPANVQHKLEAGGVAAEVLKASCPVFGSTLSVGVAVWSDDDALTRAMEAAMELVRISPFVLPNVEMELTRLASVSLTSADDAKRELGVVWGGRAGEEWAQNNMDASHEPGLMIDVGRASLSMHVAHELQGRAMAFFVMQLGRTFCHLVTCLSDGCRAMASEFRQAAQMYGIDVLEKQDDDMPADADAAAEWTLAGLLVDACAGNVYVLCVDLDLAQAVTSKMRDRTDLQQLVIVGPEAITRVADPVPGTIGVSLAAQPVGWDDRSAAEWSQLLGELATSEWAEQNPEWMESHEDWSGVDTLELQAMDAVMWLAQLWDAKLGSDATFSGNANISQDIRATEPFGLTGRILFGPTLQRVSGRMGMVVHKDGAWRQSAIWDLDSPTTLLFDSETYVTKRQWIDREVLLVEDGLVFPLCPCEFWTHMPPGSSMFTCKWSPTALGVGAASAVILVWDRKFEDAETRAVYAQMMHLRKLLGLQKRRGFILSSERGSKFSRSANAEPTTNYNIIPRKYLEALAKLTLLLPFEASQMDHFSSWLFSLDDSGRRRRSMVGATGSGSQASAESAPGEVSNWRYDMLCKLILETSAQLLSPDAENEEHAVVLDEESRADVSRPNTPEQVSVPSSTDDVKQKPETQEERFKFFKEHVGQLRIWGYKHGALFRDLKEIVQGFLNDIHYQLHTRYLAILDEDGGDELVNLEWNETEWWKLPDAECRFQKGEPSIPEHVEEEAEASEHGSLRSQHRPDESLESPHTAMKRQLPPSLSNVDDPTKAEDGAEEAGAPEKEEKDEEDEQQLIRGSFAALIKALECEDGHERGGERNRLLNIARNGSPEHSIVDEGAPPIKSFVAISRMASLTPGHSIMARSSSHPEKLWAGDNFGSLTGAAGGVSPSPSGSPCITRAVSSSSVEFGESNLASMGPERAGLPRYAPWAITSSLKSLGACSAGSSEHSERSEPFHRKLHSSADVPVPVALQNMDVDHHSSVRRESMPAAVSGKPDSMHSRRWQRMKPFSSTPKETDSRHLGSLFHRRRASATSNAASPRKLSVSSVEGTTPVQSTTPLSSHNRASRHASDLAAEEVARAGSGRTDDGKTAGSPAHSPSFLRHMHQSEPPRDKRGSMRASKHDHDEGGGIRERFMRSLKSFRRSFSQNADDDGGADSQVSSGRQLDMLAMSVQNEEPEEHPAGALTSRRRTSSIIASDHHLPPTFLQTPACSPSVGNHEISPAHANDAAKMYLRQDHPLVRAIRVDEQDQAEAMIEWEVGDAIHRRKGSSPKRVDEDVFISQLHRRAELLNEGFVQQIKQIVEAHRPTDFATSAAMAKIKAMAWLDTNQEQTESPRLNRDHGKPKANPFNISFSSRNRMTSGANPLEMETMTSTSANNDQRPSFLSAVGSNGLPASVSVASDDDGAGVLGDRPSIPPRVSNRARILSEQDAQLSSTMDAPPPMMRAVSEPFNLDDNTKGSNTLVTKLNTGFRQLKRQSSLMLGKRGGTAPGTANSSLTSQRACPRVRCSYGDLLDHQAEVVRELAENGDVEDGMLHRTLEQHSMKNLLAYGSAKRMSSDPMSHFSQSMRMMRNWTSMGKLPERPEEDGGRSQAEGSAESAERAEPNGFGSGSNLWGDDAPWSKWKALTELPRRTKAALRRLSSLRVQGNGGLSDVVNTREEWKFRVIAAPVKTKERMREKLHEYAKRGEMMRPFTANILDPIRATVVCDGPRQILRAVDWFLHNHDSKLPAMPIVRVKNKFSLEDASEYDGYRDLMICVVHTGKKGLRIIGEIQFHDAKLHALKLNIHKLYKVKRAEGANLI